MKRSKKMFFLIFSMFISMTFMFISKAYAKEILLDVTVYNVGETDSYYQINNNPYNMTIFLEESSYYYKATGFPYPNCFIEVYDINGNILYSRDVEGITPENEIRFNKASLTANPLRYVYSYSSGVSETGSADYSDYLSFLGSKIDISNTKLSDLSTMLGGVMGKIDETNNLLSFINSQLQTDTEPPVEYEDDYSSVLDQYKPVQNQQVFTDNTQYFSAPAETVITDTMPQATEPQQWEGVATPEAMQAEETLLTDTELIKGVENSKDAELVQDSFSADGELVQDSYSAETELVQDSFSADGELVQDSFSNTEIYSKENELQQTEIYTAVPNNPNLRWKSINGQFQ